MNRKSDLPLNYDAVWEPEECAAPVAGLMMIMMFIGAVWFGIGFTAAWLIWA